MLLSIQFCPETIMSKAEKDLLKNFLKQGAQQ
jgi:anthranilate/para-aminobenzoate synthase component II